LEKKNRRKTMLIDDLGGTLRDMSIKVSSVQLTSDDERRIRELVKELKSILDAGRTMGTNEARLV
jgi:hypothetical protein